MFRLTSFDHTARGDRSVAALGWLPGALCDSLAYADVPAPLMSNASSHASMAHSCFSACALRLRHCCFIRAWVDVRPPRSRRMISLTLPFERRLISRPETSSGDSAMDSAIETVLREYEQRAEGEMQKMLEIGPAEMVKRIDDFLLPVGPALLALSLLLALSFTPPRRSRRSRSGG